VRETLEVLSFGATGALLYFAILIRYFSKIPPSFTVMKTQHTHNKRDYKYKGFTLVETAIAMGMVAVMISSFLVVFGPAIKGIEKSLGAKEAERLTGALELELTTLKNDDIYSSALEKTYWWIRLGHTDTGSLVLVYQYRGNPASLVPSHPNYRDDGTMAPYTYNATNPGIPGVDYVIQTSVRRLNDAVDHSKIQAELAPGVLEGKVYYVKLCQLRTNADGGLEMPGNPWHVYNAGGSSYTGDFSQFVDPVLAFRAQFYEVKPALWSYIDGAAFSVADGNDAGLDPDALGNPVITKNMAVMR
jgi:type II secretory pathway pseudopilin PulG